MSRINHRQPVFGWSVVLLSTLFLSPLAAHTLCQTLLESLPVCAETQTNNSHSDLPVTPQKADTFASQTRRIEDEAIRAVKAGKPYILRIDSDNDSEPTVALYFHAVAAVILVADKDNASGFRQQSDLPTDRLLPRLSIPRAPPV